MMNFAKPAPDCFPMADKKKKLEEEISELFDEVLKYRNSDRFRELLKFCAKLNTIGSYNAMLVRMQYPGAEYVLSKENWKKKYNRRITSNAKPLIILVPFGPVSFVFDVGDTEHIPGTYYVKEDFFEQISRPSKVLGEIDKKQLQKLYNNLAYYGIKLCTDYNWNESVSAKFKPQNEELTLTIEKWDQKFAISCPTFFLLSINGRYVDEERFFAICHELGHFFCHHVSSPAFNEIAMWEYRDLTPQQKEFEAETVAWLVAARHGITDTRSVEYLAKYIDERGEIPEVDVKLMMNAVDQIESIFETKDIRRTWQYKNSRSFKRDVDKMYESKPTLGGNVTV